MDCQAVFVLLDRVAFLVEWLDPEFFGACNRFDQGFVGLFGGFASVALGGRRERSTGRPRTLLVVVDPSGKVLPGGVALV